MDCFFAVYIYTHILNCSVFRTQQSSFLYASNPGALDLLGFLGSDGGGWGVGGLGLVVCDYF